MENMKSIEQNMEKLGSGRGLGQEQAVMANLPKELPP